MTREEYLAFHRECCERMVEITAAKNADYTSGSDDPFFNFTRVEALGIASTEQGFLTRMLDKVARVITFVKKGVLRVKDESVEDTLLDLANYCLLFAGYIRAKKRSQKLEGDYEEICYLRSGEPVPEGYEIAEDLSRYSHHHEYSVMIKKAATA